MPRLDYSDGGCPSLLLEPSSTNLWVGSEGTDATLVSPLGEFGFKNINGFTYSSNQDVVGKTVSMFFLVKKSDNSAPIIGVSNNPSSDVIVRLAGSSAVSTSFTTTDLGNGFYLAEIENYAVIGTNTSSVNIQNSSGVDTFISMVQLEELSYSTSYIPTLNGTIETRTQDTASKSGLSNYINSSEGVLYAEIKAFIDDASDLNISINDGSISNTLRIRYNTFGKIQCIFLKGGSTQFTIVDSSTTITQFNKVAVSYKDNDTKLYVNGLEIGSNILSTYSVNFSELSLNRGGGGSSFQGKIKDLRVYTTALTDQELTDLTS